MTRPLTNLAVQLVAGGGRALQLRLGALDVQGWVGFAPRVAGLVVTLRPARPGPWPRLGGPWVKWRLFALSLDLDLLKASCSVTLTPGA